MAFGEFHYFSAALGKATMCNVFFPENTGSSGPYPTLYLLHGLSDDQSMWQRRTSLERYVQTLPLIVVMPDGGRGWYSRAHEGADYEGAIIDDCIGFVERTFRADARREARCIGGLSMGGYGAIKLALQHPDKFVSANGHSGAYGFGHAQWRTEEPEFRRIIGPQATGGPLDLWRIAESASQSIGQPNDAATASALPALRIDCGTSDFLIEQNREFHAHLDALKIAHEYEEFAGAHDWTYWDRHIQGAIRFHAGHLGISKPRVRA